jgi:hypothetical protein
MLWLFFQNELETSGKESEAAKTTRGVSAVQQLKDLTQAFNEFVASTDMLEVFDKINSQLTTMEDSAMALQRSMGGVVVGAEDFREQLIDAFKETQNIGGSFQDAADAVGGIATEMGRVVNPSKEVTTSMIEFSKATGASAKEAGQMVAQFATFGGTQKEAIEDISDLGKSARKSGLAAKAFTQEVAKNLKQASLYGFDKGLESIEKIVKQTQMLRTSFEKLGIKEIGTTLLDPEKALETASSLQMLGGSVGALADPFQLLYMGQKDMAKLTDEILNMSKATFTFDKETGTFSQTTEDMYLLRAQVEALGGNYEETASAGKELAKQDFVKNKFADLGKLDQDTQNLVAGLAQIGKDGKVTIDLPGFNEKVDDLGANIKDPAFITALEDYQKKAAMSDKDLALNQLSVAEKQAIDVNQIKNAVILGMDKTQRNELLTAIKTSSNATFDMFNTATKPLVPVTATGDVAVQNAVADSLQFIKKTLPTAETLQTIIDSVIKTTKGGGGGGGTTPLPVPTGTALPIPAKDAQFSGKGTLIASEGQLYKPLASDQIAVGTRLLETLNQGQIGMDLISALSKINGNSGSVGGNQTVSGKIEFGEIKVKVDVPSGVDTAQLERVLNSKDFTGKIMDIVANKTSYYQKQATLEG